MSRLLALLALAACGRVGFGGASTGSYTPLAITNPLATGLDHLPILVRVSPVDIDYALAAADGHDLRFIASDGSHVPYELERFDPGATSYVWLDVGHIGANESVMLEMDFGDPDVAPEHLAVWSADYAGVFHLDQLVDSSANANTVIDMGSTQAPGMVGAGRHFVAANSEYLTIGSVGFPFGTTPRTECAWVMTDSTELAFHWWIAYGVFASEAGYFTGRRGTAYYTGGTGDDVVVNNVYTSIGIWHYACTAYDLATVTEYLDGVLIAQAQRSWLLSPGGAFISHHIDPSAPQAGWDGTVDEVRVSTIARPADWIAAEYSTMTTDWATFGAIVR